MSGKEINTTTAKKGIDLQTTLCKNGVINVRSDRGSGDVHSVFVDSAGQVERCTCKGWTHHGHCYHGETIQANKPLCAAARACTERQSVATDGGIDDNAEYAERGRDYDREYVASCADCQFERVAPNDSGPAHEAKERHESDCDGHNVVVRVDEGEDIHNGAIWPDGVHNESDLPEGWGDDR